jgi:hypothetical protein
VRVLGPAAVFLFIAAVAFLLYWSASRKRRSRYPEVKGLPPGEQHYYLLARDQTRILDTLRLKDDQVAMLSPEERQQVDALVERFYDK